MIRVEGLTRRFGETLAVDHLDFEVGKGEIVGFLGPNGAGKSTTMRMLTGSLGASSGRAVIGGHDVVVAPREVKRLVGYLPEIPPLYPEMVVRDYVRFAARIKGVERVDAAVDDAMSRVGVGDVAGRLIGHLSKGYRQRVGLAQALVHAPQVLILDEPTSGLDPAQRVEIRQLITQLSAGDTTIVLSTHVLAEVEALCRKAIVLHRGRIVAQDAMGESGARRLRLVVARPPEQFAAALAAVADVSRVEATGVGAWRVVASRDVREEVARLAATHGLLELVAEGSLEESFLRLTGVA